MGVFSYIGMRCGKSRVSSCRMKPHCYGGVRMDRTLLAGLAVLAVALVIFTAAFSVTVYMGIRYRSTFQGSYEYQVGITPDAPLGNVTLYLPIPARGREKSPVAERIGSGALQGVPAGWNVSLIGTEKFTMLEVTAREIDPGCGCAPLILSVDALSRSRVETREAATGDLVIDTLAGKEKVPCGGRVYGVPPDAACVAYRGRIYASGTAPANSTLTVSITLVGKNSWDVFGPSSNEYRDGLMVTIPGAPGGYGLGFWVPEAGVA
jgi:hypothetical protein